MRNINMISAFCCATDCIIMWVPAKTFRYLGMIDVRGYSNILRYNFHNEKVEERCVIWHITGRVYRKHAAFRKNKLTIIYSFNNNHFSMKQWEQKIYCFKYFVTFNITKALNKGFIYIWRILIWYFPIFTTFLVSLNRIW